MCIHRECVQGRGNYRNVAISHKMNVIQEQASTYYGLNIKHLQLIFNTVCVYIKMKYDVTSVRQNLNNGSSRYQFNKSERHTKNTQFVFLE